MLQLQAELHQDRGLPAAVLPDEEQLRLHWQEVLCPDASAGACALAFQVKCAVWNSVVAGEF